MAWNKDTHKGQVREVARFVNALAGGCAWTLHQAGKLRGSAGIPDIYCTVGMTAFWVEVKVGRDKLRDSQRAFKLYSDVAGVPVVVGRVGDVADFLGL